MTTINLFFTVLFYATVAIFIFGLARKIYQYAKTPAPLKIVVAPAPMSKKGLLARFFGEIVLFSSLFKSSKWTWIFGWLFHFGLLLVLIRHLRYFWPGEVPSFLFLTQPFKYASFMMFIGIIGLLARRILVDRVRYISAPSDYLMLVLLLIITISGIVMTFTSNTPSIIQVKEFSSGLITFNFGDMPMEAIFIIHFLLVLILIAIFPISKLLHAPGVFFSPTRNQIDNARKKRHISNWALAKENNNDIENKML